MDNKISTQTKEELVRILGIQYRESSKMGKAQIPKTSRKPQYFANVVDFST